MPEPAAARCARDQRCGDARPGPDNTMTPAWAAPGAPFCHRCTAAAARVLAAMPARYAWLRHHIGDKGTRPGGDPVSGSREAPVPLRLDIDELIRAMIEILCSWEERVAAAAGLDRPATADSRRRRDEVALPAAVATLHPRLLVLLSLPAEPMQRTAGLNRRTALPAGAIGWVHPVAGFVRWYPDLSGADAGREIFRLAYQSRQLLGETIPPPAWLDGIPCKACDAAGLQVCADPQYRSECQACGDLLTPGEYLEWVRLYSRWAREQVTAGTITPADPWGYTHLAA